VSFVSGKVCATIAEINAKNENVNIGIDFISPLCLFSSFWEHICRIFGDTSILILTKNQTMGEQ